jgi:spermidine synthase
MSNHTRDTESLVSQFHDRKIDNPTFAEQIWGQMVATPPELEKKKLTEGEILPDHI